MGLGCRRHRWRRLQTFLAVIVVLWVAAACGGSEEIGEATAEAADGPTAATGSESPTSVAGSSETGPALRDLADGPRQSAVPGLVLEKAGLTVREDVTRIELQFHNTTDSSLSLSDDFELPDSEDEGARNSLSGATVTDPATGAVLTPRLFSDGLRCSCSEIDSLAAGGTAIWYADFDPLTAPGAMVDATVPAIGSLTFVNGQVAASSLADLAGGPRQSEIVGLTLERAGVTVRDDVTRVELGVRNTTDSSIALYGEFEGPDAGDTGRDDTLAGAALTDPGSGQVLVPRTFGPNERCACSHLDSLREGATATWFLDFDPVSPDSASLDLALPRFGVLTLTVPGR